MINIRRFAVLVVLCLFTAQAEVFAAEEPAEALPPDPIKEIVILGLKKTKPAVAEKPLRKFIGMDSTELDPAEVYAAVMDMGVLEPLSLDIRNGVLTVTVREKWSLFPVPIIFAGSSGTRYGGFLMDTNAFGLRDQFMAGAIYSDDGLMTMTSYQHTPLKDHVPGWRLSGLFSSEKREDKDQSNNIIRTRDLTRLQASGGLIFSLSEYLFSSLDFSYQEVHRGRYSFDEEGVVRLVTGGLTLGARKVTWDGFFLSEESFSITEEVSTGDDVFLTMRVRGTFEKPFFPGFRLRLGVGSVVGIGTPEMFESGPQASRVNILPNAFKARTLTGLSAGVEQYLYRFSFGTLSVLGAYQGVYSWGPILGHCFDHGPAGILSLYLQKVAFPALGLGISYNVEADYFQFFFSMGMSF